MSSVALIFFISCLVSFIGSLQLGPVNLYVISTTLFSQKKLAYWVAIGGSIPEFFYCYAAVYAHSFFEQNITLQIIFRLIFILLLLCISIIFWIKKTEEASLDESSMTNSASKSFLKGFTLASFNPQLLPFWIFVQVYFNSINLLKIETNNQKWALILGSGFGAFILLISIIMLVSKYRMQLLKQFSNKLYLKALSFVFFCIAIQQIIHLNNVIK